MFTSRAFRLSVLSFAVAGLATAVAITAQPEAPKATPSPSTAQPEQPPREGRPPRREGGQPGGPGAGGDRQITLGNAMKIMGRNLKTLGEQIADAKKTDENLRLLNEIQRGCVLCKGLLPREQLEHAKDDAERTRLRAEYRKQLLAVLKRLVDAETHVIDGKLDAAKADLDEIARMRDAGHTFFDVK